MVHVAVAGGAGGIGRHIVEAILATKKHTVTVLTRSPTHPSLQSLGANIVVVDYDSHASLVSALQGVHTIICTMWAPGDTLTTIQLALLEASIETGVKRFAPSEWAIASGPSNPISVYRPKIPVVDALRKSGLEYTLFENGIFMNYLASGTAGLGHLGPLRFIIDVENCTAKLPGTGDDKISFTSAEDIGAFVAASLDAPPGEWPEKSGMAGDVKSYNEVVALAEKVRGRKFTTTYVSEEELCKQLVPDPPSAMTNVFTEYMLAMINGKFVFETNLNKLYPEVKLTKVEDLIRKWWTGNN